MMRSLSRRVVRSVAMALMALLTFAVSFGLPTVPVAQAQGTTLSAGDIVIIGIGTDTAFEAFSFVPLVDLAMGTEITFTDSGWQSDNTFRANEGAVKYTAPSMIAAGTVISFSTNDALAAPFSSAGDANVGNGSFLLSASGDQVLAFQGDSASPTFIFAAQTNSTQWQTGSDSSNESDLPQGLTDGVNAVAAGAGSGAGDEFDNVWYEGITSGTEAEILAAVADNANWSGSDDNATYTPFTTNFTIGAGQMDTTPPMVTARSPQDNATGVNPAITQITLTFDETVDEGIEDFRLFELTNQVTPVFDATDESDNYDITNGTTLTVTLTNVTLTANTDYYIEMASGSIQDLAGNDFAGFSGVNGWNFTTGDMVPSCNGTPITLISAVQGSGTSSPVEGQTGAIQGIVVGDFQGDDGLRGFYVQEEDADVDGNPMTSEGIFVFDGSSPAVDVNVGDRVCVSGEVDEFFGETQIDSITQVTVESSNNPLPTAASITLPVANTITNSDGELIPDLEQYEGMLVTFPQSLTVVEFFNLDRFGEVRVAQGGRLFQFTNSNAPSVSGFAAHQEDIASRRITIDDGFSGQNPDPIVLPTGDPVTASTVFRNGDTLSSVTGVVRFSRGSGGSGDEDYRIQPTSGATLTQGNPRPTSLPDVGGNLKVASFNVLNYFNTLDGNGDICGPGSSQGCRGADNQTEFDRQQEKLVTSLLALNADIVGLIEVENDYELGANSSIATLVNALNAQAGAGTWAFVDPGGAVGSDAIAVGFIYKTASVGVAAGTTVEVLDDSNLPNGFSAPIFTGVNTNRSPLAVTFEDLSNDETVTIAVNHFKSKGGSPDDCSVPANDLDCDQSDGQANWNQRRLVGAQALNAWLQTDPTGSNDPDILIIGDLNAYGQEDPITELEQSYTNLLDLYVQGEPYSFLFDGQLGALDTALATGSLVPQVTGTAEIHINADEIDAIDYNTDFGRPTDIFDGTIPFRSSDHDPVLVGLSLSDMDNTAPRVVMTNPMSGATDVALDSEFTIVFSEPVIPTAAAAGATFVCDRGTTPGLGMFTITNNNTSFTSNLNGDLPASATCTLTVPLGALVDAAQNPLVDNDGNPTDGVLTYSFSTVPTQPRITALAPMEGAVDVPTNTTLAITVSEQVRIIAPGITFTCGVETQTSTVLFNESTLTYTLTPTDRLPADSRCEYRVPTTTIEDVDGDNQNLLDDDGTVDGVYTWSFTTEAAPEIVSFSPMDGATGVAADSNIVVTASENLVPVNFAALSFVCDDVVQTFPTLTNLTTAPVYTLDPVGDLPDSATCVLTLPTSALTDVNGNELQDTDGTDDNMVKLTFDTVVTAPTLVSSFPANEAVNVPVDTDFTVTFSEFPLIAVPANGPYSFVCVANAQSFDQVPNVARVVPNAIDRQFTLEFTNDLPENAECTVTIPTAFLQDSDGNSLVDDDEPDNDNQLVIVFNTAAAVAAEVEAVAPVAPIIEGAEVEAPVIESGS